MRYTNERVGYYSSIYADWLGSDLILAMEVEFRKCGMAQAEVVEYGQAVWDVNHDFYTDTDFDEHVQSWPLVTPLPGMNRPWMTPYRHAPQGYIATYGFDAICVAKDGSIVYQLFRDPPAPPAPDAAIVGHNHSAGSPPDWHDTSVVRAFNHQESGFWNLSMILGNHGSLYSIERRINGEAAVMVRNAQTGHGTGLLTWPPAFQQSLGDADTLTPHQRVHLVGPNDEIMIVLIDNDYWSIQRTTDGQLLGFDGDTSFIEPPASDGLLLGVRIHANRSDETCWIEQRTFWGSGGSIGHGFDRTFRARYSILYLNTYNAADNRIYRREIRVQRRRTGPGSDCGDFEPLSFDWERKLLLRYTPWVEDYPHDELRTKIQYRNVPRTLRIESWSLSNIQGSPSDVPVLSRHDGYQVRLRAGQQSEGQERLRRHMEPEHGIPISEFRPYWVDYCRYSLQMVELVKGNIVIFNDSKQWGEEDAWTQSLQDQVFVLTFAPLQ